MLMKFRSVRVHEALQERRVSTLDCHRFGTTKPIVTQPVRRLPVPNDIKGDSIGYAIMSSEATQPVVENLINELPTAKYREAMGDRTTELRKIIPRRQRELLELMSEARGGARDCLQPGTPGTGTACGAIPFRAPVFASGFVDETQDR